LLGHDLGVGFQVGHEQCPQHDDDESSVHEGVRG